MRFSWSYGRYGGAVGKGSGKVYLQCNMSLIVANERSRRGVIHAGVSYANGCLLH